MTGMDWIEARRWSWLEHSMVGHRRWLSLAGVGYCLLTILMTAIAVVFYAGAVDLLPGRTVRLVDGYSAVMVFGAVLSATVLPAVYGLLNGGPGMAVAIGLSPYVSAVVFRIELTLTNDLVMALVAASLGAVLALASGWYHVAKIAGEEWPDRGSLDGLLLASAVTAVAVAAVWRFDRSATADALATIDPYLWLVVIPVVGCLTLWGVVGLSYQDR